MTTLHPVSVLVPVAVGRPYTYAADRPLAPGTVVVVPLGPRHVLGCVWPGEVDDVPEGKLREVARIYDLPPLPESLLRFVEWLANYTFSPLGMVLRMVLRSPNALEPERTLVGVRLAGPPPDRVTPARRRVIEIAADGLAWAKAGLAATAGVSTGVVDGLVQAGTLELVEMTPRSPSAGLDPDHKPAGLSEIQSSTAETLVASVQAGSFSTTLLDGVTGSGKTEVYFEALAQVLREGRQALVLLPEISLTGEFLDRFARRFGARPAEWHSEVGAKGRERVWRDAASGEARVVVGARSALFLPFRDLALIVVDEEHEGAYKQEEGVTYNARDMAVVRGRLADAPVVLASATPSVETRVNADRGRYAHVRLPARFGGAAPPAVSVVDLRTNPPERLHWLAPPLVEAMTEAFGEKKQSLLFLNRRGYAPLTLCRTCGHRMACPNCSTWLVDHRFRRILGCHHCGHEERRPELCPSCGAEDSLVACGPGVERLQEEVVHRFPEARTLVLSSDMPGGAQRLRLELDAIARGEADIVIGTQLVAKGHNFPGLSLVGVVDSDLGLANGDPRAAERTFQLLTQVTGRAGRAGQASRGLLQTYAPEHPVIAALVSGNREAFYAQETEIRRRGRLPPFGRLAAIIVSAGDRPTAQAHAQAMARMAPVEPAVALLGPAEAPFAVLRGRHRFRLLAQSESASLLHSWLRAWLQAAPRARGSVNVAVDIDPMSFL
ncbi:replication restart DNA helicase PriA [Faunimonas pinastri]|uniref:Replication restart protein PriA n=1 Tax=Faunimonas pinastri TaxID=1855383 RepID=A0A1H9CVH5_9HYPH|nr:primosomal protein N' [Faunimonas pinastri]SEQ05185.1 replication restart DNA helicase PriA [Faunimonas pinastri]